MGRIFSQAFHVLVWLGTPKSLEDYEESLEYLRFYASHLHKDYRAHSNSKLRTTALPALEKLSAYQRFEAFNLAHVLILDAEWFQRLWTIQRICFGQKKTNSTIRAIRVHLHALQHDHSVEAGSQCIKGAIMDPIY
jgi:hypothetical protein